MVAVHGPRVAGAQGGTQRKRHLGPASGGNGGQAVPRQTPRRGPGVRGGASGAGSARSFSAGVANGKLVTNPCTHFPAERCQDFVEATDAAEFTQLPWIALGQS